ncbi:MAG: hypothetical protein NW217_02075 [Hyphomicrobiaceae bacterium]|nr:hypothetical protein [Hyphomicrobiaceae bacterium]
MRAVSRFGSGGASRLAVLLLAGLLAHAGSTSVAHAQDKISLEIDKRLGVQAGAGAGAAVEKFARSSLICLDLKVRLDGRDPEALRRSAEEENPYAVSRDLVPCGPQATGQLTMGPGVEYYLMAEGGGGSGARVDLSIYPGTRTEHIVNDVSCDFDADGTTASFRARGLYRPMTNRYADVDVNGNATGGAVVSVQLRPVVPTRADLTACAP